ncbi:uncharacterized protein si:dkey-86e18.1 [Thalassophryne amazonica]|uniref:uncharacterized protein si:dkey-86e18.1 n=1 Tax=Thalassophryne amazonica TaxID=390379 RepID=UPI001470DDD6|nr:uncharacterized protein si:dkey-86e18.1 [Thalassophryne amazonica]
MARNEEKQQGRLNRLWLQRERQEGRLKDTQERRPKLSTLNSVSSVKKWIPSIKNEIEYYLQQSQLSHYPDRKIAEFQLRIATLEKEYKSFIAKLRVLDPTCKHKPWTPRAYCKRRSDAEDSPTTVKHSRTCKSDSGDGQSRGAQSDLTKDRTGHPKASLSEKQLPLSQSEIRYQNTVPANPISQEVCAVQDEPLSFDRTRLAVAAAAFRGPSVHGSSQTQSLAEVLQRGLPNLINSPSQQSRGNVEHKEKSDGARMGFDVGQKSPAHEQKPDCEAGKRMPGKLPDSVTEEDSTSHVLGLDSYISSDEELST